MDRYFSSVPLAKWASENNFTIIGTMRLDHIGLPNKIKTMEGREEKLTKYLYQKDGDALLVSYALRVSYADKKIKEKNIVALSTRHSSVFVTKDEWKKPHIHRFYDQTKEGVNMVDLISSHKSTHFKSPRWPADALAFLHDTNWTNSKVLLAESLKPNVMSTFEFTFRLGKQLVLPAIQHRFDNSNGIQSSAM